MGIMDLFRPRWRHSDSRVRLWAVDSLIDQPPIQIACGHADLDDLTKNDGKLPRWLG
ncbi:MAG: hypothetical protein AB2L07_08890 [Thermoanaerobaculaceae bacterium]